jgi:hypothetical protein
VLPIPAAIFCFDKSFSKPFKEPFFFVSKLPVKILAIPNRIVIHPILVECKQPILKEFSKASHHSVSDGSAHTTDGCD